MNPSSAISAPSAPTSERENSIRRLPVAVQAAYHRFQCNGDPAGLDLVLFGILTHIIPRSSSTLVAELPDSTRLITDLGFDSLAITEVVFFTEDIFGISISYEEIIQMGTIADLRSFISQKVTTPARL